MKLPVLVDVDGVLTDGFYGKCIRIVNDRFGTDYEMSQMSGDIRTAMSEWDEKMEEICRSSGFCSDFKPEEGSQEWIEKVRQNYKVIFVTSPYKNSPTWGHDRIKWLEKHFEATRDDVILAHDKQYVAGLTLIDDLPKNCFAWSKFNQRRATLIVKPWNAETITSKDTKFLVLSRGSAKWRPVVF